MVKSRPILITATVVGCLALSIPAVAVAGGPISAKSISATVKVPAEWSNLAPGLVSVPESTASMLADEEANAPITELGNEIAFAAGTHEDFAFAYVENNGFVVGFAGEVPGDVAGALKSAGNVRFIENVGYTDDDLEATDTVLAEAIAAKVPEAASVGAGFKQATKQLQISVALNEETKDPEELKSRIAAVVAGIPTFGYVVDITMGVAKEGAVDFQGYGQAGGTGLQGASGFCTSSFVARNPSSGALGVFTAAHCENTLQQGGANPFTFINYQPEHFGLNGDVQFMHSPVMMDAWFHASHGVGRPVLGVRNAYGGETVYKYGVVTNQTSGPVNHDNYSLTVVSPLTGSSTTLGGLTRVTSSMASSDGDSGGPLFGGNTAMGLLVGRQALGNYVLFTKISNAQLATGAITCMDPVCS